MVSTGQAAKLCAVTPDTILKWIKKRQIEAVKTAGGHYRVSMEVLKPYLMAPRAPEGNGPGEEPTEIDYCWEYHASNGQIDDNCRECMIFKTKAERCYLMAGLGSKSGHAQTFCKNSCYECEYFQFVNKTPINVLVITENQSFQRDLASQVRENLMLKFSCCGYETATVIQDFRPDFIMLDESMVKSNPNEICRHLITDPRTHQSQIVLGTTKRKKKLPEGVCASIKMPFQASDMEECLGNLRDNFFGKRPEATAKPDPDC